MKITRYKAPDKWPVKCTGCGEQRHAAGFISYWAHPDPLPDGGVSACMAFDPLCEACVAVLLEADSFTAQFIPGDNALHPLMPGQSWRMR